jgi:hypothetical protein
MPINKNLNQAPYFDDYDAEKQFYRVMFKPGYAIQARELTQLQTMLQNQVESFGDNVFKEGSVVKGCNFTELDDLQFVKLNDVSASFNAEAYISGPAVETILGQEVEVDYVYEIRGQATGLKAEIVQASKGFQTRPPNLNTFFINYLNIGVLGQTQFQAGEALVLTRYKFLRGTTTEALTTNTVISQGLEVYGGGATPAVGKAFGIEAAPGIIFQKGHFIFTAEQRLVVEKYSNTPDDKSVGYLVEEKFTSAIQDASLYDNANGAKNENAPGADRLNLVPTLTVLTTSEGTANPDFFTLIRYQNGNPITIRDVSQYNVLGEEMARRTYEESGNYILENFPLSTDDRAGEVQLVVGNGTAYVKGYRIENSGERSFQIDQIASTETIEAQNVGMEYGNYFEIDQSSASRGYIDLNLQVKSDIQTASSQSAGSVAVHNITPSRVYIHHAAFTGAQPLSSVTKLNDASNGSGDLPLKVTGFGAPIIKETNRKALIFDTGVDGLFATTNTYIPVRTQVTGTATTGTITITANPGEDFNCINDISEILVNQAGVQHPVISKTVQLNNSQLNIVCDSALNGSVEIFFNKRLVGSSGGIDPFNKTVTLPCIKSNYTTSVSKYSLGFPDVFGIVSIITEGTGPGGINEDWTNSFRLKTNQKDTMYDISYIEYIEGRPKPANGILVTTMKAFKLSASTGNYFFTINSYPNTLERYEIPSYTSESGQVYNLRDCFDFRPHVDKISNANYTATIPAQAPTITTTVGTQPITFATAPNPLIPAAQQSLQTDLEHYLSRIDTIACDSYGDIILIKGEEQKNAIPPKLETDQLAIANVEIPTFPALSKKQSDILNKSAYSIKPRATGIKNYTMKDMHQLEKKIDNMAYYISLNQLESETSNMVIRDENGLNRFKNGFVVDPFNNLELSEVQHPQFNAAVPFNKKILTPSLKTFALDLKYDSATGSSVFPSTADAKVATIGRNSNVDIINQPYASNFRNCVSNFYKYVGDGVISPPYDAAYDTTVNPASIDIDLTTPFQEFVDSIQSFLPMTDVSTARNFVRDGGRRGRRGAGVETMTTTTRTSEIVIDDSNVTENFVGEFVSDFRFQPYMASRDIKIYMSGLRPNQRHYFFFDGVDVNAHILNGSNTANSVGEVARMGVKGASVETDANGVLRAVFHLPAETFYVGDRVLEIVDVSQYASIDSASTSKGFVTYRAYNFSVEKTSLTTSTRSPNFDVNTTVTTRNVARRIRGRDPLAQTFFIKKGMGAGSNSVYLSDIDVFFKRKPVNSGGGASATAALNGVTVQIREVVNGYPTNQILPFSAVHKLPANVNVSDDASLATTFTFEAPVRLDTEKEYSVVIQPDASDPNYLVFTSKVGGIDLTPGATKGSAITQDWGDGVLFTSTNNSAWKSYQDEDIKFTLRRHNFNSSTGTVRLTNNNHEFLTLNNVTGKFTPGELIYQEITLTDPAQNIAAVSAKLITGGTGLTDNYAVGDFIKLTSTLSGNAIEIHKIAAVTNASEMVLESPAGFTSSLTHSPVVVGELDMYDVSRDPYECHLVNSSATSVKTFAVGTLIKGLDSTSTSNVASINNINLSYIQPMIMKANDSSSRTRLSGTFVPPADLNATYLKPMQFNDNNHFTEKGVVLYSKSNDPNGAKSFKLNVTLENDSNVTSTPFVDIESSKLIAYQYKITNVADTTCKYISKRIELAEDLDAEDFELTLSAYRPADTNIKVYIKAQNGYDFDEFDNLAWTELELFEGLGSFSTAVNLDDYREFKYKIANSDKTGGNPGSAFAYTSQGGAFEGFKRFQIRIDLLSPNIHNAPTLKDYRGIALT